MDKIIKFLAYLIVLFFVFVLIDVFLFPKMIEILNSRNLQKTHFFKVNRVEYPYIGLLEKKIAETEPYSRYYKENNIYKNNEGKIKIAFFGGSTSIFNDPEKPNSKNIPQYLERILSEKLKKDVVIVNYSCAGARHRQHLHMLLEFLPEFEPDIVIFYGGNNEILSPYSDDPRVNYPFDYFYKFEYPIWKKFLLEYSAVISVLDRKFNLFNDKKLSKKVGFRSETWKAYLIKNYFETLNLSNTIVSSLDSDLFGECKFISIFQPINEYWGFENSGIKYDYEISKELDGIIDKIRDDLPKLENDAYDFYHKYDHFPKNIWYDNCHVRDEANQYMANEIADLLIDKYLMKYKK